MSQPMKSATDLSSAEKRALLANLLRQKASKAEQFPLSYAQERLWFLDQLEPGNVAYNVPMALSLAGPLNVSALERSLNQIIERHQALRTGFIVVNGDPMQIIAPALTLNLPIRDISGLPLSEQSAEVERCARAHGEQPFDLSQAPLLRTDLLRL